VDTTASVPRVLVIGLDPYRVPGPWDPKPVADAIEVGVARFAEHGVGVHTCLFGLDGSDDVEAVVTDALRRRPWECVTVGGGVRNQLELFEQVINLVRRHAPGLPVLRSRSTAPRRIPSTRPPAGSIFPDPPPRVRPQRRPASGAASTRRTSR
jgi:hypothetical protein